MSKFLAVQCRYSLQLPNIQMDATWGETGILDADLASYMKSSSKLLLVLAAATAFFVVQPVKAGHVVQGGPTYVTVPDGGSTISLLGFALLGVAALRRKLGR
jgi:VPDSG-CTERM motif